MGILIGTSFVYGEAALSGIISVTSFSLSFMSMGNVGGNILRDVLSLEGDKKAGYKTAAFLPSFYLYQHFGTRDAFRMVKTLA